MSECVCVRVNWRVGLKRANYADCHQCTPGWHCLESGLVAPTGQCLGGYFCSSGAILATPVDLSYGSRCPAGSFCPQGSWAPQPCYAGRYSASRGLAADSTCTVCPPMMHCNGTGLTEPTGLCDAGYYCSGGASARAPVDGVTGALCAAGFACPTGSAAQTPCGVGEFSNTTGAAACKPCPAGFSCDGSQPTTPVLCARGHYCPVGTGASSPACAEGTYNSNYGSLDVSACHACPAGVFCVGIGATGNAGNCSAGYVCGGSNVNAFGGAVGGPPEVACPRGSFCPSGSPAPTNCPPTTFATTVAARSELACILCLDGHYCSESGLVEPTALCAEGSWCRRGVRSTAPRTGVSNVSVAIAGGAVVQVTVGGDVCPAGYVCRAGSVDPTPCGAGMYNSLLGQGVEGCRVCPASFHCPAATANFANTPCPPGYYCKEGTQFAMQYPCPAGTFSNQSAMADDRGCDPCTAGAYCEGEGNTRVTGAARAADTVQCCCL